jgi:hypothetical protein
MVIRMAGPFLALWDARLDVLILDDVVSNGLASEE